MPISLENLTERITVAQEQLAQLSQDIATRQRAALVLQGKIIAWNELAQEMAGEEKEQEHADVNSGSDNP